MGSFDSGNVWGTLIYGVSTGGSLSVGLVFLRLLFGRLDKKEAYVDAGMKALVDELKEEIVRLTARADATDAKLRECEERDANRHAELLQVKALLQARGEIRNRIQVGVAAEKLLGKDE